MAGSGTQSLRRAGPASLEYIVLKTEEQPVNQPQCGEHVECLERPGGGGPHRGLGVGHRGKLLLFLFFFLSFFKMQFSVSGLSCSIYELSCCLWDLVP